MLLIKNPKYIDANQERLNKYAVQIAGYIESLPSNLEKITFDKIRADIVGMNLPDVMASDITDDKLMMICEAEGIEVVLSE